MGRDALVRISGGARCPNSQSCALPPQPCAPSGLCGLRPPSGPGPVVSDKAHPYVPNGQGQSTYRVADLTNPILKPWVIEQMRKANERVLAGKIPFIARERCWPAGVPAVDIYN